MRLDHSWPLMIGLTALASCAHPVKDPGAYRASHRSIVGMPGILNHHSKYTGILMQAELPKFETSCHPGNLSASPIPFAKQDCNSTVTDSRQLSTEAFSASVSFLRFPYGDSFFFWGISLTGSLAQHSYEERSNRWTVLEPELADVTWRTQNINVGIPFGISKNYDNGTTVVSGIGLKRRVWHSTRFVSDGSSDGVDERLRDRTVRSFEDSEDEIKLHYVAMIGYSLK